MFKKLSSLTIIKNIICLISNFSIQRIEVLIATLSAKLFLKT